MLALLFGGHLLGGCSVVYFFILFVGLLVGWLVGWLFGWLVRWLVHSFVGLVCSFHMTRKADCSHAEVMIRCVQE